MRRTTGYLHVTGRTNHRRSFDLDMETKCRLSVCLNSREGTFLTLKSPDQEILLMIKNWLKHPLKSSPRYCKFLLC